MNGIVDEVIDRLAAWLGWSGKPAPEPAWLVVVGQQQSAPQRLTRPGPICGHWSV